VPGMALIRVRSAADASLRSLSWRPGSFVAGLPSKRQTSCVGSGSVAPWCIGVNDSVASQTTCLAGQNLGREMGWLPGVVPG